MQQVLDHNYALDYILAGKALFTVKNTRTNNRFTFKVEAKKDTYFVKVLNGPDNGSNYLYIGAIMRGTFRLTKGSKVGVDATSFKTFQYILNGLITKTLPSYISIFHHGHCAKCGKTLTVPESIITGLGPHCASMIVKRNQGRLFK